MDEILQRIDEYKKNVDAKRPLSAGELKQVQEYFRIGLTYSSNALEGNSLTETETKIAHLPRQSLFDRNGDKDCLGRWADREWKASA